MIGSNRLVFLDGVDIQVRESDNSFYRKKMGDKCRSATRDLVMVLNSTLHRQNVTKLAL